jgi:hypothetical protein
MDTAIRPRPESHPACASCAKPVCLWAPDWSLACFSDCTADNGERIEDDAVHDDCREHYFTLKVRDYLRDGLLVRRGAEINTLTASERANNLSSGVIELLRAFGVLKEENGR